MTRVPRVERRSIVRSNAAASEPFTASINRYRVGRLRAYTVASRKRAPAPRSGARQTGALRPGL